MNKRSQIFLAFVSVYILWGSTFVAIRYVTRLLHPAFVSDLRYVLAAIFAMSYLLLCRRSVRLSKAEWARVTLLGFLMFTINTTLVNYGAKVLSAGLTALFVASIPLFIALLETTLAGGERMSKMGWLGTLTGFAGLALLTSRGIHGQALTSDAALASLGLICAALAWAAGTVISRRMPIQAAPLVSTTWQMLIAGSINMVIGLGCGGLQSSNWTSGAILAILYLAIFGLWLAIPRTCSWCATSGSRPLLPTLTSIRLWPSYLDGSSCMKPYMAPSGQAWE